jgi:hypothetical protein
MPFAGPTLQPQAQPRPQAMGTAPPQAPRPLVHPHEREIDLNGTDLWMFPYIMPTRTTTTVPRGMPLGLMLPRDSRYVDPTGTHVGFHTATVVFLDEPVSVTGTNAWVPCRQQDLEAADRYREELMLPDRPAGPPIHARGSLFPSELRTRPETHRVATRTMATQTPTQPEQETPAPQTASIPQATVRLDRSRGLVPLSVSIPDMDVEQMDDPLSISPILPQQFMRDDPEVDSAGTEAETFHGNMRGLRHAEDQQPKPLMPVRTVSPARTPPGAALTTDPVLEVFTVRGNHEDAASDVVDLVTEYSVVAKPPSPEPASAAAMERKSATPSTSRPTKATNAVAQKRRRKKASLQGAKSSPTKELETEATAAPTVTDPGDNSGTPDEEVDSLAKKAESLNLSPKR